LRKSELEDWPKAPISGAGCLRDATCLWLRTCTSRSA